MDEEFQNRVIRDLEESGFGSEMKAIRKFLAHQWNCKSGGGWFDRDEQKIREVDLEAYQCISSGDDKVSCYFFIVAERPHLASLSSKIRLRAGRRPRREVLKVAGEAVRGPDERERWHPKRVMLETARQISYIGCWQQSTLRGMYES